MVVGANQKTQKDLPGAVGEAELTPVKGVSLGLTSILQVRLVLPFLSLLSKFLRILQPQNLVRTPWAVGGIADTLPALPAPPLPSHQQQLPLSCRGPQPPPDVHGEECAAAVKDGGQR